MKTTMTGSVALAVVAMAGAFAGCGPEDEFDGSPEVATSQQAASVTHKQQNLTTGQCIYAPGPAGAQVQVRKCGSTGSQNLTYSGSNGALTIKVNALCLAKSGSALITAACDGSGNQKWKETPIWVGNTFFGLLFSNSNGGQMRNTSSNGNVTIQSSGTGGFYWMTK